MTISCLRSHLRHLQLSRDSVKRLQRLTNSRQWRWGLIILGVRLNDRGNLQFRGPILLISPTKVVGQVSPALSHQFIKHRLLLPKTLHPMLYSFVVCTHHPAGFIIFAQLAQLGILFIIIFVFPILPIFRTCTITQTISNGIQNLLLCCFRLCGCQSRHFSIYHIFLLLLNCCLCVFNSLSYHKGLSIHIISNPCPLICVAQTVSFSSFPHCKQLWLSKSMQCS